jgi:ABC-type glycerol-3-phosphate transport system substrate-binding protein
MKSGLLLGALMLALTACGARTTLQPKAGTAMPQASITAAHTPTAVELMTPDVQAQPKRSDELLRRSEERREDKFDLPPT